jgi:SagB-type dehydrogenase family enzyme
MCRVDDWAVTTPGAERRYRRSPYLALCWEGEQLVLSHCISLRRFRADARLLETLSSLATWATIEDLNARTPKITEDVIDRLVDMGILEVAGKQLGGSSADAVWWSPFELVVHRLANDGAPVVGAGADVAPPPAFKSRPPGHAIGLPPPAAVTVALDDALARRRSVRTYSDRALGDGELSSLLHHAARVRRVLVGPLGEEVLRPYPTGGARSELEIYVVANDLEGVPPGAYFYDSRAHDLVHVRDADAGQERLNARLHASTGGLLSRDPPVVLILTAVAARTLWKYPRTGLSLVYKDTGCLLQTLYLAATALGLAPCAVNGGGEAENTAWLGIDPLTECQVALFLVGPMASEHSGPGPARR